MRRLQLLNDDYFAIQFPYNEVLIDKVKQLQTRRWNPTEKWWEIHLAHLPQVMAQLQVAPGQVPAEVRAAYEKQWKGLDCRLLVNNHMTAVSGINLPLELLDEALSFWLPGAEYSPKYQDGSWDGQRHLLDRRDGYHFPTGLLPRLLKVLDTQQVRYQLVDQRADSVPSLSFKPHAVKLRGYQKEVIAACLKHDRGVMEMATGGGKTVVAGCIIAELRRRTLFLVHTKDLLYQAIRFLSEILNCPVGQIGDGKFTPEQVTVATIQTCARAYHLEVKGKDRDPEEDTEPEEKGVAKSREKELREVLASAEVVFFDECHHVPADTCYDLALKLERARYRYGLSATPYRADRLDMLLEGAIGDKIARVNASRLIQEGHLVAPRITFYRIPYQKFGFESTYHDIYQLAVVENKERNALIRSLGERHVAEGKTVLVLVNQVKHGQILEKLIPGAVLLTGNDKSSFRNETLERLRNREQKLLIATTLADEGLDIPSLDVLMLAGAGKSETKALQRIGRALRRVPGKEAAYVVDFWDQCRFLTEHSKSRLEIYQTEPLFQVDITDARSGQPLPIHDLLSTKTNARASRRQRE